MQYITQDFSSLTKWSADCFQFICGIEKEGLRVDQSGIISQSNHPAGLGSALTHPYITTDYSEALLEFITPALTGSDNLLDFLHKLHNYTYQKMSPDELIWPGSMPSILPDELSVRIAEYGTSNIGRLKHIYRHGLWHRYGRKMQAIAGVHFNFSLPDSFWIMLKEEQQSELSLTDFRSQGYFRMIRNFKRHSWLLMYLFGASPAIDKSFGGSDQTLVPAGQRSLYLPFAASLRMSDVGYTNRAQDGLNVSLNSLEEYIQSLRNAIHRKHPPYKELGIKKDGRYLQINDNILQIENEYYSDIRPKRVTNPGEKPVCALKRRGVEYVEVRCVDLDPFEPVGISSDTIHFLQAFLVCCLLQPDEKINEDEGARLRQNLRLVVHDAYRPGLKLKSADGQLNLLTDLVDSQLQGLNTLAEKIDQAVGTSRYTQAIQKARELAANPENISANKVRRMLTNQGDYAELMVNIAMQHRKDYFDKPLSEETLNNLDKLSEESKSTQQKMEQEQQVPFEKYIEDYRHQDDKYCD